MLQIGDRTLRVPDLTHLAPLGSRPQRILWWFCWSALALPGLLAFRWIPGDAPKVPRDGPFLLVANHTSFFDPIWIAWWIVRRSSFMASAALFHMPVLRWLLPICGCFPKTKFVKDRDSMRTLAERYAAGDVIVIFPEGTRSFDGRTRDVLPGIGRLVKRLNARVVCARVRNGHLFHPRWARFPRWVPIRVEYDQPRTWGEDATVEQINADISLGIRVDPVDPPTGLFSAGYRMAEGLPDYLWACPLCFEQEGLLAAGNRVRCRSCQAHWTLDTRNRMNGEHPLWIHQAFDKIQFHFQDIDLRGRAELVRLEGRRRVRVDRGPASLTDAGLKVGDTVIGFEEVRGVSVELQNRLMFRRDGALLELIPESQSALKWAHFLRRRLEEAERQAG